jgi:transcriptional regulator with XRE-family HTH domain
MPERNVLRVNTAEETDAYRSAVAEILRRVQMEHSLTLLEIAERLDVSLGTISNAANKKADLSPTYLGRIGQRFGVEALDPYLATMGGRAVPIDPEAKRDILPVMTRAQLRIVEARDPSSPGGARETLQEQSAFLPDLLKLQSELEATIADIRRRLAA